MKLSTRGHYGLRAMGELARAYGQGPLALAEIAEVEKLSLAYLEQLFASLRKAGLVESTRGVRGGYELTRDPSTIKVGQIVRVLEGPIAFVECAAEDASPSCCEREENCPSRLVWQKVRDSVAEVLDSMTLADLANRQPAATAALDSH